jgi:hypothetical protein
LQRTTTLDYAEYLRCNIRSTAITQLLTLFLKAADATIARGHYQHNDRAKRLIKKTRGAVSGSPRVNSTAIPRAAGHDEADLKAILYLINNISW